ncbi:MULTISPECIES: type II toxin-antitoxin system VapC family toxin [Methylorubrum]|uniref:Ribonuclease VapC n=1 Tax=Methylorubrum extorquens TaxID=408 RepID=A0AAX3WHI9_METEX|nr:MULTISPECIES: type II toxin-antitoxin system VapC family toxin [Methylobacteriaceae]KQO95636.1 twitching motility protein PilT [Methylobacterium sp. Leaf92]KQQ18793.1 twitching motility protein PilT [Methylobacterium sp. Leaf122]MCY1644601.1 type II toxin-antitoxin system VapC family toxin [Methylorubrum sp. SL192]WHQ70115.1 type II toxin-antitoxin system VapC family toxin [Methylorubrum extorquens]
MFVDASAMVAILIGEPQRSPLLKCLDGAAAPITSALAVFETVAAVTRRRAQSAEASEMQVHEFLRSASITIVPIAEAEGQAALTAFARFGKGQGHPAQLNMGDCFAYACARTRNVPLLFVGNDFSQTDIANATG